MATRKKTEAELIRELRGRIRRLENNAASLNKESRRLAALLDEENRRLEGDSKRGQKVAWLLYEMLGRPRMQRERVTFGTLREGGRPVVRRPELFDTTVLHEVARLSGSKLPWRKLLKMDTIAVARWLSRLHGDHTHDDEERERLRGRMFVSDGTQVVLVRKRRRGRR